MSSTLQGPDHGTRDTEIKQFTLKAFYGMQKGNLPGSVTGEGTVMQKMEAIMPNASARMQEIPCQPTGKAGELTTCLLLYEPADDVPMKAVFSLLKKHVPTYHWRIASSLVNVHDTKRVSDALQGYLSQKTDIESKENNPAEELESQGGRPAILDLNREDRQVASDTATKAPCSPKEPSTIQSGVQLGSEGVSKTLEATDLQVKPLDLEADDDGNCEGKLAPETGNSGASVVLPQQGDATSFNETSVNLTYPTAECEALAEEEARFCSGMENNVEELVNLSNLANQYLQKSHDQSPPIINESSSPTEIFAALSLIRRQMKQGMDLLEGFEGLRLQRRGLAEGLDEQVTRAQNWVKAYDGIHSSRFWLETSDIISHHMFFSSPLSEAIQSQERTTRDEVQKPDGETSPRSSTVEELDVNSRASPDSDVDEASSSDESFYHGLKDDSASVNEA
ncbi:hypothetical protein M407DRAFT_217585 [Tulasnella calospora MUT 4182]|uniref:Uncharacterized protein n=1 Tax=Tulasnella calospora MUT 4182 TaxID=1051891 RepID=A0A0C3KK04_9AGAM|nr:hypothetical protein M407DRAFT_217585 [Tulasnella calospora MUT 4182]